MSFEVVELRRYTLQPGKRDALIEIFEREFIETQEATGMVPVGHYRDLDDPDSFVWFRGFPAASARAASLDEFYRRSPAWLAHRDAANATMIDSDNVLLLRAARPEVCFDLRGLVRPASGGSAARSFVGIAIYLLDEAPTQAFVQRFETVFLPVLRRSCERVAYFVSDGRPNDFPALPVREGEHAFVVSAVCEDAAALAAFSKTFTGQACEVLRLDPAARALLR